METAMVLQATKRTSEQLNKALRVYVLGRFEVEQGTHLIENEQWRSGKARSLFKIMLARRNFLISRQEVGELLWPELDQERAANNLNQALYSLRRILEPELKQASASVYIKTDGAQLQLNPEMISWIDVEEFKRISRQAQLNHEVTLYEQAVMLYRGDYLPEDLYEDWSIYRREALRQDWLELLIQLAALYQSQAQDEKYQQCLQRILETDFSHESTVQKLMIALAESGRREEALTFYRNFATKLRSRLNLEPLTETRELYQEIAAGKIGYLRNQKSEISTSRLPGITQSAEVSVPSDFKSLSAFPAETIVATSSALPVSSTPAVNQPIAAIFPQSVGGEGYRWLWEQQLNRGLAGQSSLTLLVGEAGIGKTYLAQMLAQQASRAGFELFFTTCYPEQADLPFGPICDLLEQAFGKLTDTELEECLKYCNPKLFRFLPGLLARVQSSKFAAILNVKPTSSMFSLREEPSGGADELFERHSKLEAQDVFSAVTQLIGWLSNRRPLVLVLDDLQYMPGPSLRLLRCLLTQPNLRSLVVLGTLRPVATALAQPELTRLLSWAAETPQALYQLQRLKPKELRELIRSHLGQSPTLNLLNQVSEISGGNPRLALELLTAWRKEERLQRIDGMWELASAASTPIPAGISSYIKRLFDSFSPNAQVLLLLASQIALQTKVQLSRASLRAEFAFESGPTSPVQNSLEPELYLLEQKFQARNSELQADELAPEASNFELSFSFEVLRQIVLHRSDGAGWWIGLEKHRLGPALQEVTECGLLEEQGTEFRFAYPMLAESLNYSLSNSQRQCWREVINWAQQRINPEIVLDEETTLTF